MSSDEGAVSDAGVGRFSSLDEGNTGCPVTLTFDRFASASEGRGVNGGLAVDRSEGLDEGVSEDAVVVPRAAAAEPA